jgi:hypothetical protein
LALVPRHAGPRDRTRPGGHAGPGRPLHVRTAGRPRDHAGLGRRRPAVATPARASFAGGDRGGDPHGPRRLRLDPGLALARHDRTSRTGDRGDGGKLRRPP